MYPTVLTAVVSLVSGFVALCMIVLIMACSPNSTPQVYAGLKTLMLVTFIATAVCVAGAVVSLVMRQPAAALTLAWFPLQVCAIVLVILLDMSKAQVDAEAVPSTASVVVRSLAWLIFGGGGAVMFYVGAREHFYQRLLLANAEPVTATIVESHVFTSETSNTHSPGDLRDDSTTSHRPDVKFRYTFGGNAYESDLLRPSAIVRGYASRDAAAKELVPFPVGATVTAFVSPALPAKAYLLRESSSGPLVFLIVGSILGPAALLVGRWI